ncbi:ATP-binding cassette domain-containing protein [Alkaliphilus sp. B6464]|uniref:ATP-binding cassette domain-containing protein n=1 Tax=Alkaliphilus sp. B6464 TaxID=2731219 RepID=UPI001BABE7F5|nr:ABC transporter ATP-binding protein [Alkaliphilus sp. B6464]QUH18842.1 ABC transporter ATP-binding protein [Alkaliphilus sp. B6464]
MNPKKLIIKHLNKIILITILIVVSTVLNISGPIILKRLISENDSDSIELFNLLIYFLIITLYYLSLYIFSKLQTNFSKKFKEQETLELYRSVFKMDYETLLKSQMTYLVSRIKSVVDSFFSIVGQGLSRILALGITLVTIIIIMSTYNKYLALLYIIVIPINVLGFKRINKKLTARSSELQHVCADNFKNIISFMSNYEYIKQAQSDEVLYQYLSEYVTRIENENSKLQHYAKTIGLFLEYLLKLVEVCIFMFIVYLFTKGTIDVSVFIMLNLLNSIFYSSLKSINEVNINLRDIKASFNFVNDLILQNQEVDNGNLVLQEVESIRIDVNDLKYGKNLLIQSGNLNAEKGDKVAIIGASGVGKSSLLKMIPRLISSNTTRILINNIQIEQITLTSLRKKILYLSQTPNIFPITIKENLCLENTNLADKVISLKTFEKFNNLENGLDTLVVEGAANLSGGDRQKIVLGRLMNSNYDVIILDEATNSIDEETSDELIQKVFEIFNDKIIFIITHNENIAEKCNKKYKIDNKIIAEVATNE